jgi:hypothetical protein
VNGLIHLKAATDPTNGVFNRDDADWDNNSSITVTNPKTNKRAKTTTTQSPYDQRLVVVAVMKTTIAKF